MPESGLPAAAEEGDEARADDSVMKWKAIYGMRGLETQGMKGCSERGGF